MAAPKRRVPRRDFTDLTGLRVGLYCRVSQENAGADQATREKSVDDQESEGRSWVERSRTVLTDVYRDSDRSASRFADKEREQFNRLLGDVEDGRLDMVWVWAIDRSQRNLRVFAEMRDLFVQQQVALSVNGKLYSPNDYDDWMLLGITSFFGERYAEELSKNVRRGQRSSAMSGKPHGRLTYGYKRVYDEHTRELIGQEPDLWDGDGRAVEDSPAWVVREIFRRLAAGDSYSGIVRDLNDRAVPTPGKLAWMRSGKRQGPKSGRPMTPPRWEATGIKVIARNVAYIGQRRYAGEILDVETVWPALVDQRVFWAVQQRLRAVPHGNHRWGRAKHLLACLAMCDACGAWLTQNPGGSNRSPANYYCMANACAAIKQDVLDDYVEHVIIGWLSDPEVYAELTRVDDSAVALQARAEADQLRVDLEDWRRQAEAGEVTATSFARVEKDRLARIAEAEKRAQAATVPSVLAGNIGPQAAQRWAGLDMAVKRQIIAAVAEIRLIPAGRRGRYVPVGDRVRWTPLLGADREGEQWAPTPPAELKAARQARHDAAAALRAEKIAARQARQARHDAAAALRQQGLSYEQIAQKVGVSGSTVWLWLREPAAELTEREGGPQT